jgi:hypothetical protein
MFAMTGDLTVLDPLTNEPVHFDVTGQGRLSTSWVDVCAGGCFPDGQSQYFLVVHYDFRPVSEPTALMLLVTGVAAVGWRYRGGGRR